MRDSPRSTLHWPLLLLLSAAGFAVVMGLTAPRGPGVSTDAVQYIAAADTFAQSGRFLTFTGRPLVNFPPLYPLLLASSRLLFGIDPVVSARVMNAFAFSATILLAGLVFWVLMPSSRWWGTFASLSVLVSPSFLALYTNILSDPLFIVLTLLFLLAAQRYLHTASPRLFLGVAFICALAALTRYVGVTLIVPGLLLISYSNWPSRRERISKAALFVCVSLAPLAVWLVRNVSLVGLPFGYRDPTERLPLGNASDLTTKVAHWFIPDGVGAPAFYCLLVVVLMLIILAGRKAATRMNGARHFLSAQPASIMVGVFLMAYSAALLLSIETPEHIGLVFDDRFYLPMYVPIVLLLCLLIRRVLLTMLPPSLAHKGEMFLIIAFSVWLLYPGFFGARLAWRSAARGWIPYYNIYNTPRFLDSDVTGWLQEGVATQYPLVYSNQSAAAYLILRRPVEASPINRGRDGERVPLNSYRGVWPQQDGALLLWYEAKKDTAYPLDQLARLAYLDPLRSSEYAWIFIVRAK